MADAPAIWFPFIQTYAGVLLANRPMEPIHLLPRYCCPSRVRNPGLPWLQTAIQTPDLANLRKETVEQAFNSPSGILRSLTSSGKRPSPSSQSVWGWLTVSSRLPNQSCS